MNQRPADPESLAKERPFVEALARRLVLDPNAADDLVQETLLAAMKDPPRKTTRGWLSRVVRNLAYRSLRNDERRRRREHAVARPDAEPAAADVVARAAWHRRVVDTVLSLDEPYRSTLLLRFYDDLTPKEIAERQGVPAATVRTRLKRGLERMREALDAEHGDRRNWCVALLPLAFAPERAASASAAGIAVGVAVMTAKQKLIVAATLVVALAGTVGLGGRALRETNGAERQSGARASVTDASGPETPAAATSDAPASPFTVRVLRSDGGPIEGARVEILDPRPRPGGPYMSQHIWRDRALAVARGERVAASGRTDAAGEVALDVGEDTGFGLRASHGEYATVAQWVWNSRARSAEIRLGRAHTLTGRVLDDEGGAVSGALVLVGDARPQLRLGTGAPPQRAVADESGRYRFDALPGRERTLWAAWPGGYPVPVARIRFPDIRSFDIVLERGGVLAGSVRTPEGEPLAGVAVFVEFRDDQVRGYATTDASGAYRIDPMAPGFVGKIMLEKDGYAQVHEAVGPDLRVRPGESTRLDGVMTRGAVVRGVVRGPDGPLADVHVASFHNAGYPGGTVVRNARTDEDGRYALTGLPEGAHVLGALKSGYETLMATSVFEAVEDEDHPLVVRLARGEEVERDFELRRGDRVVEGVVLGPDGAPFPGATVHARGGRATAGDDGRFVIHVFEDASLVAHAEGHTTGGGAFPVPDRAHVEGVVLRLARKRPLLLSGRVAGVRGESWVALKSLPREQKAYAAMPRWLNAQRAIVGADGRYEIEIPRHGNFFAARVEASGRWPTAARSFELEEDRHGYTLDFEIPESHTLEGSCRPGARIHVIRPRTLQERLQPLSNLRVDATADAHGAFAVGGLPAGEWEVHAEARGCAPAWAKVRVPQEEPLVLEPEPQVSLSGVVVFEDGEPAAGARVYAWELDEKGNSRPRQGGNYGTVIDAHGRWSLDALRPGRLQLIVQGSDECNLVRLEDKGVRGGQHGLRHVVRRGLTIEGTVVDAEGEGVPDVHLHAQQGAWIRGQGSTDADGRFSLRGLPPGEHVVRLRSGSVRWEYGKIPAGARAVRIVFDPTREDLGRADVKAIEGRLLDADGAPLAGMHVTARSKDADPAAWAPHRDVTDDEGRFSIPRLDPGAYRLDIDVRDEGVHPLRDLGVFEAGTGPIEIRARRGLRIAGRVRDPGGEPRAGAWVRGGVAGHDDVWVKTDARGRFEIGDFPGGSRCELSAFGEKLAPAYVADVEAGARDVLIVVHPGLEVAGVVVDGGRAKVVAVAIDDPKRRRSAMADESGRFRLTNLLEGRYRVTVNGKPAGEVEAGATDVALRAK